MGPDSSSANSTPAPVPLRPVQLLIDRPYEPSSQRREVLDRLAEYIAAPRGGMTNLIFICTHNSRRSTIAQVWAAAAAAWFSLDRVRTFSGGTETTAFNPRAVAALRRVGFAIAGEDEGDNPRYLLNLHPDREPLPLYSKGFDAPENPSTDFAAVMTCSDADQNCPYVPGTDLRLALTYDDPKEADGTPEETARYDERVREIGEEILYAFAGARALLS